MFYIFFLFYNLLWILGILFFSLYYFFTKQGKILYDRLNMGDPEFVEPIWLHAASVGEVKIAEVLIKEIRKISMQPILLTVVTKTGKKIADSIKAQHFASVYAPFDFLPIVLGFLAKYSIKTAIFIETEIWPSFIIANKWNNVRQFIVNARLSDKSYPRYKFFKFFLKQLLMKFNLILAQSKEDKNRFVSLGVQKERALVVNNIKYDMLDIVDDINHDKDVVFYGRPTFTAGSLRDGEELELVEVMQTLNKRFDNFFGIIAPRHLKNVKKIEKLLRKKGLRYVCYSDMQKFLEASKHIKNGKTFVEANVVIVDVMGELVNLYKNSDVVFVGGSFVKCGGQNIIEPACLGKLVLFGPHMENFRDAAFKFLHAGGAIQVKNHGELIEKVDVYLRDKNERCHIVHKVLRCLKDSKGGARETIRSII